MQSESGSCRSTPVGFTFCCRRRTANMRRQHDRCADREQGDLRLTVSVTYVRAAAADGLNLPAASVDI
ncbi:hypothetical protein GOODEAATRI_022616 [Goodea atripinnis]|uniref:Uncharacterized protein n=1 Tax=Goodea atripinnis TaxID=208336 RepID=A0ABV0NX11_9TELE